MAGWDSPVLADHNKVRARRNRSLTKEEVEAFWKQQRRDPEDGGAGAVRVRAPLFRSSSSPAARGVKVIETGTGTGWSSPAPARAEEAGFVFPGGNNDVVVDGESPSRSRDWWTRSSWAFLNEPPREEALARAQSYAPQFHVARIATTGGNAA